MTAEFHFPTHVIFGPGTVLEIPERIRGWGRRLLIVTGRSVLATGLLDPLLAALAATDTDYRVFDGVEGNPTEENVLSGLQRFHDGCDHLLAIGGGSAVDAAKAIRLLARYGGPIERFEQPAGAREVRGGLAPMVAVPTTAGAGNEVSATAVIAVSNRKRPLAAPALMPELAVCDPELTLRLPSRITAGSGARALVQNLESYLATSYHPVCDAIALEGFRRAAAHLPAVVRHPLDIEARTGMMEAALLSGIAAQKGLGAVHALARPLTSVAGVHHGTACAVMLPHVLRYNAPAIEERVRMLCRAAEFPQESDRPAGECLADRLAELFHECAIPARLHDLGVPQALFQPMARLAAEDPCLRTNPRQINAESLLDLYRAAG